MAAELGQQTVDFSTLINRAAEDSFISLKELVENCKSPDQSDTDKKISLLKYILKTQQRMLRLNVVAKWCQQVPLIHYCQQLASTLSSHETCFTQAADSLFFMHEGLQQARAPVYDVPSAIEVLLTGSYHRLPKCIEDVGMQSTLGEDQKKPAFKKLDTLLRSKLLEVSLPKEISEVKVSEGTALLRVDREFRVLVTLGYRGHLSLWRILHMELLVGGKSGMIKLEEFRQHALGDDLERRMAASENPFSILYSIIHELCVSLTMDTVIRQVQALRQGRWRDAIRFELISDASVGHGGSAGTTQVNQDGEVDTSSLRIPGVKIIYWLDSDKNSSQPDTGSYPFIKIELGPDLQIKCLHSTFVIDPLTGKEADFMLDQSCIDVERLLLRAICCNRYTRLLEIQRDLAKNAQIFRGAGDVLLEFHMEEADVASEKKVNSREHEGQEVLRVRAYGSSFFTLGINIRTGHFLLQSSQNIIEPSAVSECEDALNQGSMNAAEVFTSLRNKSIVHLFASIGKFLGLEVYEHGFPAVKLPNDISNDSAMLIMGFPDCGSSYLLIMQLDKDFKPLFKLLETQPEGPGKAHSFNDFNNVIHIKKIDIDQMQMLEDEMNMSLLDWEKLRSLFQRAGGPNHSSENSFLSDISLGSSMQIAGWPPSSFSSVVDEVFEVEAGSSFLPSSIHNNVSSSSSSRYMAFPLTLHAMKAGTPSPKWEERMQISQVNNSAKLPSSASHYNGSFPSSNLKGQALSNSFGSLSSVSGRSTSARELSASKSDQDLCSLRSPQSAEFSSCTSVDEDQLRPLNDTQKDAMYGRPARLLSPPQCAGPRISGFNVKPNGFRGSPTGFLPGSFRVSGPASVLQTLDSTLCHSPSPELVSEHEKNPRKRTLSDMFNLIPSLQGVEVNSLSCKRRKVLDSSIAPPSSRILVVPKTDRFSYGLLIGESNKGNAPSSVYVSALLHVVRHCSLSIKHARLTSQMDDLDIPYVEEVGLRSVSSNIWFRLPLARGDTWQHICLRLGRPGSMYWDVKIRDQHFRDLWELQKGSNSTPWGSGVCIANTFDMDSHIRYDPEGVVLCYKSVEENSIKRLVADIQRLSNARLFSLGMIKLLGVRADEKLEESCTSPDGKAPAGVKNSTDTADRSSEQMRRAFRIEAVGLMSLRFSFGSGVVVARFVVEWESGKEGCTMHVSPDQLWPHTKFLEDFINGAEVASLLDCIRLTAGPLHALVAATRPARAGPIPGVPGAAAAFSTLPKQIGYLSQGLLPSSLTTNVTQASFGPMGNSVGATAGNPLANNSFHGAAMLAAAARGGPGIVPSSLLPIDVSVVLRGPYWIRIIYRKNFAVDMRCFAGDQVWLQPAAPPKGGPSVGGSIPCPQFRPFIMEHVAQELHGLEPNFGGGQHTVMTNSNSQNPSSGSQVQATNGNRVNPPSTAAMSRTSNQVAAFNRMGNALPISSTVVSSGMPVRRAPGSAVPAHLRGELNTAIIGLGDDGGYGGGWVPLVALKKVLRGILKYLGVLWLFAQLPDILKEILGSLLKDNEGALLNLDQEQPALRFFVGGYVFAVSVHRVQLLLQVLSVKRFHHQQQQQQQQQNSNSVQEELTQLEISEICDYFSRRVASEPYDASRVASFITLLTLPISVLREFLKLIAWKKGITQALGGDIAPAQRPRIELCLENHAGSSTDEGSENSSVAKSNIHYNRLHNSVDCALTVVLDPAHIPHTNAAGGAAWLPYCVSVRLKYFFGENPKVSFLDMEGSHGGQACWSCLDDWEKCKQRVDRTVEVHGCAAGDVNQGRLKAVADSVQRTLNLCLQGLRDGGLTVSSGAA